MPVQPQVVGVVGNTGKGLAPSLTLPASQPDDVTVVHLLTSGVPAFTPPPGWGAVADQAIVGLALSSAKSYCYTIGGQPGAFTGSLSGTTAREWAVVGIVVRGAAIEQARTDVKASPGGQIQYGAQTPAADNDLRVALGVWRDPTSPPPGSRDGFPAGWDQLIDVNTNVAADAPSNYAGWIDSHQLGAGTAGVLIPNEFGSLTIGALQSVMMVVFQPIPDAPTDGPWARRGGWRGSRAEWRNWGSELTV